jgi:hypothetical protein
MSEFIFLSISLLSGCASILGFMTMIDSSCYPVISFGSGLWFTLSFRFLRRHFGLQIWKMSDIPYLSLVWAFAMSMILFDCLFLNFSKKRGVEVVFFALNWSAGIFGMAVWVAWLTLKFLDWLGFCPNEEEECPSHYERMRFLDDLEKSEENSYGRITPSSDILSVPDPRFHQFSHYHHEGIS